MATSDRLASYPHKRDFARTREVAAAAPGAARARGDPPAPAKLRITNAERVIDASSGTTKADLVRFYASVATLMLPHLRERPVALLRAPRGVDGSKFFQKHVGHKDELPHIDVFDPSLDPDHEPLLGISSAGALASIAQMNVIEVHSWNATTRAIGRPDRLVFDLDPGEGVNWGKVQKAASLLHGFLDELGLASFAKTSGGKGLHIVLPLRPNHDWDTVKRLAHAIVVHLAQTIPKRFVAKSGAKNRVGRIYIDYLRNAFGATTIAAWSARARPGLGVSVPIAWTELDKLSSGAHWSVANIGERLERGNAPWDACEASRQDVSAALERLGIEAPARA
jgi:bifunctional non-homologous end joining protein LigD